MNWEELSVTFSLTSQEWLLVAMLVVGGSFVSNFLILFHTQKGHITHFLIKMLYSKSLLLSFAFCLFDFILVMVLYGFRPYSLLIACVLFVFFVLSYIDCILLAVPDWINFLCFFGIFAGLYYLNLLRDENIISSLCVAGGLAILRIFGSFVFRKEILGEADIVVFASMGALLSIYLSLQLLFLACLLAMVYILILAFVSLKEKEITISKIKVPFVTFLTLAFIVMLVYKQYGGDLV